MSWKVLLLLLLLLLRLCAFMLFISVDIAVWLMNNSKQAKTQLTQLLLQSTYLAAGMRRAGVQPNTVSYNSLLSVCERCGQAERALEVFRSMEREAGPTFGYTASSLVTYNTLISACGKAGMYDQVHSIHAEMQAKGINGDVFTMCGLITACERVCHAAKFMCCCLHPAAVVLAVTTPMCAQCMASALLTQLD